ncbi:addiction module component [Roseivirga sp.]|uniref:addiction module component n=1 Tax=Roseivirga sp. TaxID=1964215 RepID=UPI003B52268B
MDIQSEKLDLIQWIAGLDDLSLIKLVSSIKLSDELGKEDLSDELKSALDESLVDIKEGKTLSQEHVKNQTREKFPHLFK